MSTHAPALREALEQQHAALLTRHEPKAVIEALDAVPSHAHYHQVPDAVRSRFSAIAGEFGDAGFEAFQKVLLLRLMEKFDARSVGRRYSDAVVRWLYEPIGSGSRSGNCAGSWAGRSRTDARTCAVVVSER